MFCLGLGGPGGGGLPPAYPIPIPDRVTPTYERGGGERERPTAARPAPGPRPRRAERRRAAGDRARPQSHAAEVPRLSDPAPGAAQGAWQGRADPLCLTRCASPVNPLPIEPEDVLVEVGGEVL